MNAYQELQAAFQSVLREFLTNAGVRRVFEGPLSIANYASYLRQVFHHTRENPQIQALATVYFRGHQRAAIKRFFRHASSEIGHDQLALDDLNALGVDTSTLPIENPLPETTALISFPFYQIHNLNPVGYLGYLYFLEFLPTGSGNEVMHSFERAGIPREAMTFLHDHSTIDVGHNRFMHEYAQTLITNERELSSVIYAMRVTSRLYAGMVEAAFREADAPADWGYSTTECANDVQSIPPADSWSAQTGERPALGLSSAASTRNVNAG
jgi:hypothetical protein